MDKLRFPPGFSTEERDAERREKLTTKGVIYDVVLLDWIDRTDMEGNSLVYKQWVSKAPKKEFELPNEPFDEVTYNIHVWQSPTN